jgi:hypothetical protein
MAVLVRDSIHRQVAWKKARTWRGVSFFGLLSSPLPDFASDDFRRFDRSLLMVCVSHTRAKHCICTVGSVPETFIEEGV